MSQVSSG